ncbi:pirin family protein [Bacteroidota bacterium]
MRDTRKIDRIFYGKHTSDGAGVKLMRVFGFQEEGLLDPFLLLDFFGSDNPDDYLAGFPWHPHRGIETVTYMLDGKVQHGDNMGNKGVIGKGDIQWMTAGSGIIHEEMPQQSDGKMRGFQLWVNLPASHKMMEPRYQEIVAHDIPEVNPDKNVKIKVIAGEYDAVKGPVVDIVADPIYFDIAIGKDSEFTIEVIPDYTVFVFVYEGSAKFDDSEKGKLKTGQGALLVNGSSVRIKTTEENVKFLLMSGKPINEPIAWRGPIVMNTYEELETAFKEYREANFIK